MNAQKISFESMEWENPKPGLFQKIYSKGEERIRLIRFEADFKEEDWCMNAHKGLVLKGQMKLDFNGNMVEYKAGDGLWINQGHPEKHKVIISPGTFVELVVFETN